MLQVSAQLLQVQLFVLQVAIRATSSSICATGLKMGQNRASTCIFLRNTNVSRKDAEAAVKKTALREKIVKAAVRHGLWTCIFFSEASCLLYCCCTVQYNKALIYCGYRLQERVAVATT